MTDEVQLSTLSLWLGTCQSGHPKCMVEQDQLYRPSRLIEVRSPGEENVCLVETKRFNSFTEEYMALSHCWGLSMPESAKTTSASLNSHLQAIKLSDLPKTFVDFITIARGMDVPYVWIDSLCIIQDDLHDWQVQSAQMKSVYSSACLTISAASAPDGSFGCRLGSKFASTGSALNFEWDGTPYSSEFGKGRIRLIPEIEWDITPTILFSDCPIQKRGWTFQEYELSPRVASFCQEIIRWECASLTASLYRPWGEPFFGKNLIAGLGEHELGDEDQWHNMTTWTNLIQVYTMRQLTRQTDRLPAIGGIARKFGETFPSTFPGKYCAGIWESHGALGLLWEPEGRTGGVSRATTDYIAPSWSWAALDRPASYGLPAPDSALLAEIISMEASPTGPDEYGMASSGSLRIRGKVKKFQVAGMESHVYEGCLVVSDDVFARPQLDELEKGLELEEDVLFLPE